MHIEGAKGDEQVPIDDIRALSIERGFFWRRLIIETRSGQRLTFSGLSSKTAAAFGKTFDSALAAYRYAQQLIEASRPDAEKAL